MGKRGPQPNTKKKKTYVCELCNKSFRDSFVLKVHNRIHTGEEPFSCDICSRTFARISHRDRHKIVHTGERPYSCDKCPKSFTQHYDMLRHRARHTGEKFMFTCNNCDKSFMIKANLEKHMLSHEGQIDGDIKSEMQSKTLTNDSKKNLKKTKAKLKKIKKGDSISESEASAPDHLQDEFSDDNVFNNENHIRTESGITVKNEDNNDLDISRGFINDTNELGTVGDSIVQTKVKASTKLTPKCDKNPLKSVKKSPKPSIKKSLKASLKKTIGKSLKRPQNSFKTETSPPNNFGEVLLGNDFAIDKAGKGDTPTNNSAKTTISNDFTTDEDVESGTEKAFLCPIDDCDEIRLSSDLNDGADLDHLIHDHGLKKVQIKKMDLSWQLVAICRFKSRST